MKGRRARWTLYLTPLVLPWVVVSWGTGHYTLFALGWIDPGFRVVSMLTFLTHGAVSLGTRSFTLAYPLALALYLVGLALVARRDADGSVLGASLWFLSGLNVLFFALGVARQGELMAVPLGTAWFWFVGSVEYRAALRD